MREGSPIVVISAFSPISFTFRLLERNFLAVAGPLFLMACLAQLDWLLLDFEVLTDSWSVGLLLVVWLPISAYCQAGMLRFCLRAARGQSYGFRTLWQLDSSVVRLLWLKLLTVAVLVGAALLLSMSLPRQEELDWLGRLPNFSETMGLSGQVVLVLSSLVLLGVLAVRTIIAPVLIVDARMGALQALLASLRLTRGHSVAIIVYGVILALIGGLAQTFLAGPAQAALAAPGIVYLGLALRGELVD